MHLEGMSTAGIARTLHRSWNTIARWIKRAADHAHGFQEKALQHLEAVELQIDELHTHVGGIERAKWVYTSIEVWARLWNATHVGQRTRRDALLHLRKVRDQVLPASPPPLISTDGFQWYEKIIPRLFGPTCVYVMVEKKYGKGRIRRPRTRLIMGTQDDLDLAFQRSEDSRKINTSYVERLNLTIRRHLACLQRRTTANVRTPEKLLDSVRLLQCYYNFVRPHASLKFGKETRTPAMQAGLANRRLTLRDIFLALCPDRIDVQSPKTTSKGVASAPSWSCPPGIAAGRAA